MTDYKRKCGTTFEHNWITEFSRWTLPRSEAPESFIFWTGLFSISSVLRRRVYVPAKGMLGSWDCAPNMYILFVADPGKARKTTTADYSVDLLDNIPDIVFAPDQVTMEKLLSTIVHSPDSSMCIHSGEFGEFMVKSGLNMYSFLTNAYDGRKKISAGTHIRSVELAERPCVNLLGATTPAWIADNMPESVIGGGFASRVIFVYEERVRRRQLYYRSLDYKVLDDIKQNLIDDLRHISQLEGTFDIEEDAIDFMEEWYKKESEAGTEEQYKMHGYFERKPAHAHKLAMIIHASYSDSLTLTRDDFKAALKLLRQVEQKLPKTFESVGKNPFVQEMRRILEFVDSVGEIKDQELRAKFMSSANPKVLDELIAGLVNAGKLIAEQNGTGLILRSKKIIAPR